MTFAKTTLIAAVIFSGVTNLASAGNLDVVHELSNSTGGSGYQITPLTRAQVKADLLAAQANGDIIVGENGETARELNPRLYSATSVAIKAPKSRSEVRAEFLAAQKSGDLIIGENGERARDLNAHAFTANAVPADAVAHPTVAAGRRARAVDSTYFGI